ncbi:hypothetical protein D3C76_1833860 [compost metagenome]
MGAPDPDSSSSQLLHRLYGPRRQEPDDNSHANGLQVLQQLVLLQFAPLWVSLILHYVKQHEADRVSLRATWA